MVYASPSNLIKLKALNSPKIIPIEDFKTYINSKLDMLNDIVDQQIIYKNKSIWCIFKNYGHLEVVSKKFDVKKLRERANLLIRKTELSGIESFIEKIEIKSELEEFVNTYPLLKVLSEYSFSSDLFPHINAYINSIDEGFL